MVLIHIVLFYVLLLLKVQVRISGLSMQIIESYLKVGFGHFLSHAYMRFFLACYPTLRV